jgi:hypothetical protein
MTRIVKTATANTTVLSNRYKILRTEGTGRISVTYGAVDLLTTGAVAVTSISKRRAAAPNAPYPLSRMRADAAFSLKVVHPGILHAYDQFDDEDFIHLVSEYSGLPPISELGARTMRPDPLAFVQAMQKVVYAVEYYHSGGTQGCFIRPQHVRLSSMGECQIDGFLDCRLSFLTESHETLARRMTDRRDDAAHTDITLAGEVMTLLLAEMPKHGGKISREDTVAYEASGALSKIAAKMCGGEYFSINQVTAAMAEVDDRIRAGLSTNNRSFPPSTKRRKLAAGETLFREGDFHNGEAFIIERGLIQISMAGVNGRDIHLDVSTPGDIVGDMALIDRQPRMATARALEPCTLVVISLAEFDTTLKKMDPPSRRLLKVLVSRLRHQAREVTRLKALIGISK